MQPSVVPAWSWGAAASWGGSGDKSWVGEECGLALGRDPQPGPGYSVPSLPAVTLQRAAVPSNTGFAGISVIALP